MVAFYFIGHFVHSLAFGGGGGHFNTEVIGVCRWDSETPPYSYIHNLCECIPIHIF